MFAKLKADVHHLARSQGALLGALGWRSRAPKLQPEQLMVGWWHLQDWLHWQTAFARPCMMFFQRQRWASA